MTRGPLVAPWLPVQRVCPEALPVAGPRHLPGQESCNFVGCVPVALAETQEHWSVSVCLFSLCCFCLWPVMLTPQLITLVPLFK